MKKFNLRASFPKVTMLNRTIIIIMVAVFIFLLALIFITALTPKQTQNNTTPISAVNQNEGEVTQTVRQLPGYNDFAQINKLLQQKQPQQSQAQITLLRQQLATLQKTQQALQQQVITLRQRPRPSVSRAIITHNPSPEEQQADSSSIFFNGGAPNANAETKLIAQQAKNQDKTHVVSNKKIVDGANKQQNKLDFLNKNTDEKEIFSTHVLQLLRSPYELLQGTFIPAVLMTATDSDVPGAVKAEVRQNVYDTATGRNLLIPQGTVLIGKYNSNVSYGQTRVQMVFSRLIRPDGSSIQLSNPQASENTGINGLSGDVNNHWGRIIGSAFLVSAFSVPAVVLDRNTGGFNQFNGGSALGYSLANGVGQVGNQLVSKSLGIQPSIELPPGKMLTVMVNKDMIISPYLVKTI